MIPSFRPLELPSDTRLLQELLKEGFPETLSEMNFSNEMLTWKFADSAKMGLSLIGFSGNVAVSFYGVLARQYCFLGSKRIVGLVVDVMSSPSMRGKGLFTATGRETMNQLARTDVSAVIGFPIRSEVLPGHLRVGWKVNFSMPVYVLPIGAAKASGMQKVMVNFCLRILYSLMLPLRIIAKGKVARFSVQSFLNDDRVFRFYRTSADNNTVVLDKSEQFLRWRLSKPDSNYVCFTLGDKEVFASAIVRVMTFEGFKTLAIVDLESKSKRISRQIMCDLTSYAEEMKCDLIGFCTNPSNFRRLGLGRFGFFRSPAKFKVITRSINCPSIVDSEKLFRLSWLDSDTV